MSCLKESNAVLVLAGVGANVDKTPVTEQPDGSCQRPPVAIPSKASRQACFSLAPFVIIFDPPTSPAIARDQTFKSGGIALPEAHSLLHHSTSQNPSSAPEHIIKSAFSINSALALRSPIFRNGSHQGGSLSVSPVPGLTPLWLRGSHRQKDYRGEKSPVPSRQRLTTEHNMATENEPAPPGG